MSSAVCVLLYLPSLSGGRLTKVSSLTAFKIFLLAWNCQKGTALFQKWRRLIECSFSSARPLYVYRIAFYKLLTESSCPNSNNVDPYNFFYPNNAARSRQTVNILRQRHQTPRASEQEISHLVGEGSCYCVLTFIYFLVPNFIQVQTRVSMNIHYEMIPCR